MRRRPATTACPLLASISSTARCIRIVFHAITAFESNVSAEDTAARESCFLFEPFVISACPCSSRPLLRVNLPGGEISSALNLFLQAARRGRSGQSIRRMNRRGRRSVPSASDSAASTNRSVMVSCLRYFPRNRHSRLRNCDSREAICATSYCCSR
jgi:hypothetical protein